MKKIILYFLLLLLFTWLGVLISKDSGYVLIAYGNTTIETTLWMGIVALLSIFLILYFLLRVDFALRNLPSNIKIGLSNRSAKKARVLLKKGLIAKMSRDWKKAEKFLHKALKIKGGDFGFINYLACADLANEQGADEKRDIYLSAAAAVDRDASVEIELVRAQWQVQNQQWQEALFTLNQIRKNKPKHKMLLSLLHQVYLHLKEWRNLQMLLPLLRRYRVLSLLDANSLEKIICRGLLLESLTTDKSDKVTKIWHKMPRALHYDAEMLVIYTGFLVVNNLHDKAERLLFKMPPKVCWSGQIISRDMAQVELTADISAQTAAVTWKQKLLERYSTFANSNPLKQLKTAEKWLQSHPQDPELLLCLGRICKQQRLWGKARNYLDKSLKLSPTAPTYYELGQIIEGLGETTAALHYYRDGLKHEIAG